MTGSPICFERLGRVAAPDLPGFPGTHLQTPTPLDLGDRIRVFASTRLDGKSRAVYVDIEPQEPFRIIDWSRSPILDAGELGTFDDEGVMPAFCMRDAANSHRLLMLYSGWNTRNTIRYHNTTGLAHSQDLGLSWSRPFKGPVLERTPYEPYLAVTPWVVPSPGGEFQAWYISGTGWIRVEGISEPLYVIKHAVSKNLISWKRDGQQVVPSLFDDECFSRPSVASVGRRQIMLFCSRSSRDYRGGAGSYRLGAALRIGQEFARVPVEIGGEPGEWEKTMQCYPAWLNVGTSWYVLYNGDRFGATGFGILKHVA